MAPGTSESLNCASGLHRMCRAFYGQNPAENYTYPAMRDKRRRASDRVVENAFSLLAFRPLLPPPVDCQHPRLEVTDDGILEQLTPGHLPHAKDNPASIERLILSEQATKLDKS